MLGEHGGDLAQVEADARGLRRDQEGDGDQHRDPGLRLEEDEEPAVRIRLQLAAQRGVLVRPAASYGLPLRTDGLKEPRLFIGSPDGRAQELAMTDGTARWLDVFHVPGEYRVEVVDGVGLVDVVGVNVDVDVLVGVCVPLGVVDGVGVPVCVGETVGLDVGVWLAVGV